MEVIGENIYYYAEDEPKDIDKKELLQAGVGAITGLGSALAQRPQRERRALSEIEQKCGKRPLFKRAQQGWQDCVNRVNETNARKVEQEDKRQRTNKNLLIIGGVVVGVAILGFIAYRISKRG
jgi:hypothetical protein